ncbi:hypothetical protein HYT25_04445 [Candidatus Pacearchaeota archaeon]|nr:hypothetical protein [Candidatus Pacearchaeota archaeon]
MRQKTMYKEIFSVMIGVILISSNVLAFAVSSQYYGNNPLYLQPGESMETFFTLQNLASSEDVRLQARITEGADIIEMTDSSDIYDVPAGEKTRVNFIVTAPASAKKGDSFPVTIMFGTITSGEGPIALSGSIGKGFNLVIGAPSDFDENGNLKTNLSWIAYVVIALVIACAAIFIFYLRKRRNMKPKWKR